MIETTRYFYDDDVLAKMILAAEKNPSTKKLGQRVDEELMKRWTQGVYTPGLNKADEVFQSLKLDQLGDKVLAIPLFGYFSRYVDRYNQANRGKEEPMLSALSQRSVVVMIAAAKKNPKRALETERTVIIAVVPANVDMHNTEILQAAQEADSNGTRTIAVVTKVDLVDAGAELAVHELLLNKKKRMHLGYHAVKCRSQRELTKGTSIDKGVANELAFFGQHEYWRKL
ncbi:hypothetical protein PF005_g29628, partial [Phytophthora fragariae]